MGPQEPWPSLLGFLVLVLYATAATARHNIDPNLLKTVERSEKTAFEEAYEATYNGESQAVIGKTVEAYESLVHWLVGSQGSMYAQVHELHSHAVRSIINDIVQLAAKPLDEQAAITKLQSISDRLNTQVALKYGHPVARRVLTGALLKMRSEHGPFSKALQSKVDKILVQLFLLHKQNMAARGSIQFLHVSKSGGTNLCMTAEANGCSSEGFDEKQNCLIKEFADVPHWVAYQAHRYVEYRITGSEEPLIDNLWFVNFGGVGGRTRGGCAERYAKLRSRSFNFYANEFTLPSGESTACKQFVNMILMRNPIDRLRSQIGWIQKLYLEKYPEHDISLAFKSRTSGFWERLMPAAVNNYYIRSLLGQKYFLAPVQAVNETHVLPAKLQVLLHDVVLTLENKQFNDIVLQVGMGWGKSLAEDNIRSSSAVKSELSMPLDFPTLEERNQPDMQVYEFARGLQVLDVMVFNFVQALDRQLGGTAELLSSAGCGYVALPEA